MFKKVTILILLSFGTAMSTAAATFVVPSDREMIQRCDAIIVGVASDSIATLNIYGGVETFTAFEIEEVVKGAIFASTIPVREPGGVYGTRATVIPGVPRFAKGQRIVLFLPQSCPGVWSVTDLALGKFTFETDEDGRDVLVRQESDVVGWDPDGSLHREPRRSAQRFLEFLRVQASGGSATSDYYV